MPLGNGLLCWVDSRPPPIHGGVIFSDVRDESPELSYTAEAVNYRSFLCRTNTRGVLKLISLSLSPRRCSHCGCSQNATSVDIWTLKTDDMAWVLETETMADSNDELWALEAMVAAGSRTRPPGLPLLRV